MRQVRSWLAAILGILIVLAILFIILNILVILLPIVILIVLIGAVWSWLTRKQKKEYFDINYREKR